MCMHAEIDPSCMELHRSQLARDNLLVYNTFNNIAT